MNDNLRLLAQAGEETTSGYESSQETDNTTTGTTDDITDQTVMRNKPKLIISSYDIEPDMVEAGSDFDLSITFYNTNNVNGVYNLKITLDQNLQSQPQDGGGENSSLVSDGSVFTPIGSSNTFYSAAVYAWDTTTKNIRINVLPNAKAGSYVMGVTMEYEDYLGNQYTSTESIGIPVVQKAEVTSGEINMDEPMLGEPTSVSMNIYNTGKDNLTTFMMKVEGKGFTVDDDTRFIGNFASGASDNFSFNITPESEGKINGKIIISYEDSTGKVHTEEKKFTKEVVGSASNEAVDENGNPINPETGELIEKEQNSSSILTNPISWGLVIALIVVIVIVINKKRKKKKSEDLTIDED